MNINFTARLIVDKKIKSLKQTNLNELTKQTREFVEHPVLTQLFRDDITFSNLPKARYEGLLVKYGDTEIPIDIKRPLTHGTILKILLERVCYENNIPWYMESQKGRMNFIKELLFKKGLIK